MEQLLLHLWGDYLTQSSWMAENKTKRLFPAFIHATVYSIPFFLIASPLAVLVIWVTHLIIDRYRLARFVVWFKDIVFEPEAWALFWKSAYLIGDPARYYGEFLPKMEAHERKYNWENCKSTGYPSQSPVWLTTWLLIIADNTLHMTINYLAVKFL